MPIADGGGGTAEALAISLGGTWHRAEVSDPLGRLVEARWLVLPDGSAVVEVAEAVGLARLGPDELDPIAASSRGLGELVQAALEADADALLVCLGDSATVDGGAGLLEVLDGLPVPTRVLCDVRNPLLGPRGAAHVFGPQKGASAEQVDQLEARLAALDRLRPYADLPGAGAAGGLGAAFAALGGALVEGAPLVLDLIGFRDRLLGAELVVTGEGTVDRTTSEGKAPGAALRVCGEARVRCVLFGGRIVEPLPGAELHELSGDATRAREDLIALGEMLGTTL